MYKGDDFHISSLTTDDAFLLNKLMVANVDRFRLFFPLTLAANTSIEKSVAFISAISEDEKKRTQFLYAIRTNTEIAGLVYLKELDWQKKEGEFAYCIDKKYAGKGWITQAVTKLSTFAFEELDLQTLKIIVHHTNIASVRIAEKCGFTFQKILKEGFTPPGEKSLDMHLFERYG